MTEHKNDKLRILVNASTLQVGGGIQVGLTFIEYAYKSYFEKLDFIFVVSKSLYDQLSPILQAKENIIACETSPAAIIGGKLTRKNIRQIEHKFKPDLVYSIGFPSYIRFKAPEVGRYTNPWEINAPPLPWHTIKLADRLKIFLGIRYRLLWARNATYFETQTEAAKLGILKKIRVDCDKVKVIPNSPNPIFNNEDGILHFDKNMTLKIFCLSAAYQHKNLEIIPEVAHYLKSKHGIKAEFILTIPQGNSILGFIESRAKKLNVEEHIINIGKIDLNTCLEWYRKTHLVFLPTLLEVFSATYVEAMAMRRPIVTTDLKFATDVCDDAAIYYKSRSAEAASDAIAKLTLDKNLQSLIVEKGISRLAYFPNPDEKHKLSFNWFEELAQISRKKIK